MAVSGSALTLLGTYATGVFDEGAAEIVVHDPASQRLFVTNADANTVDILSITDPSNVGLIATIDLDGLDLTSFGIPAGAFGGANSVAVNDGIVAIAVEADTATDPGYVVFTDTEGTVLGAVGVGALPDMVTFTPDGTRLLVANEGEPDDGIDPVGSISIIDLSGGIAAATVQTAGFSAFDGSAAALRAAGVRLFPDVLDGERTVSQDLEPEYIAVSEDGGTAFVTLQEANAVAVVDIATATVTAIQPLGTKDHSLPGNGLDASDKDGIDIATAPVVGMYMPDAIASFTQDGTTYYLTANEGDARDADERLEDVTLDASFHAGLVNDDDLGRLDVSTIDGDTDGDGDIDVPHAYGARSFSIWDEDGNQVFDSGDDFEQITAALLPDDFNTDNDENDFDSRSDAKGPEPEAITVGRIGEKVYAFVGLERVGGVMVYDVTDPADATFVEYVNNRNFDADPETELAAVGDLGPEGLAFIAAEDSPTGESLLAVSNEVSGTTSVYAVDLPAYTLQILHASDLEGGVEALGRAANFAALVDHFEGEVANSITLSAGDNWIPGPFFNAAGDRTTFRDEGLFNDVYNAHFGLDPADGYQSLREGGGRADVTIMNLIGFDASALGNHEFDLGPDAIGDVIAPAYEEATGIADDRWVGAQFPYLSANLDFAGSDLGWLATDEILPTDAFTSGPADSALVTEEDPAGPKIAPATIIEENGERIGVVGATTPLLGSISSPGNVSLIGPTSNDMPALAAILQPTIDAMLDDGIDKIILVSHLQQIALEKELAGLLSGVDVIVAGGSDTLQADAEDVARGLQDGDTPDEGYPLVTSNADGDTTVIVSTDGEYSYVGRLVIDFDEQGRVIADSIDETVSGAFATTDEVVRAVDTDVDTDGDTDGIQYAEGSSAALVQQVVDGVEGVVIEKDSNIVGWTDVYLDGRRSEVRTEETNLGNLTADANLWQAKQVDDTVMVSLKNGGGIRAPIGEVEEVSPGVYEELPPQTNPLSGKQEGQMSQLDIENTLRFNNDLVLLTVTAEKLVELLEHAVAGSGPGATPGQFPQVAGVEFSFDTEAPAGDRIQSATIVDEAGDPTLVLVSDGELVADPGTAIRMVTLGFLAGGGDGYPFPDLDEAGVDLVELETALAGPGQEGAFTFADAGTEQDALAEFMNTFHASRDDAFDRTETDPADDGRIQNLAERDDAVLDGVVSGGTGRDVLFGTDEADDILTGGGRDFVVTREGADRIVFNDVAGRRDVLTIADFEVGVDTLVLGDREIARAIETPARTILLLDGADRDSIVLLGVADTPLEDIA